MESQKWPFTLCKGVISKITKILGSTGNTWRLLPPIANMAENGFSTVFPTLRGRYPDACSPMSSIKGFLLHQISYLHVIFHLILLSDSSSPSWSSSQAGSSQTLLILSLYSKHVHTISIVTLLWPLIFTKPAIPLHHHHQSNFDPGLSP